MLYGNVSAKICDRTLLAINTYLETKTFHFVCLFLCVSSALMVTCSEHGPVSADDKSIEDTTHNEMPRSEEKKLVDVGAFRKGSFVHQKCQRSSAIDSEWFDKIRSIGTGDVVHESVINTEEPVGIGELSPETNVLESLGFSSAETGRGYWKKKFDIINNTVGVLSSPNVLSSFDLSDISKIDTIAMISVNRENLVGNYIYSTLRSLFSELPEEITVNVLVGNQDISYLSHEILCRELGCELVPRVNVVVPNKEMALHIETMDKVRRGSWNFARSLLTYSGKKGMVILEDDVEWAPGSFSKVVQMTSNIDIKIMSLFNNFCDDLPGRKVKFALGTTRLEASHDEAATSYSQGLYVSSDIANRLGRHQLMRLNSKCWDCLIRGFLFMNSIDMLYTYPSLIQHIGAVSSGGWGAERSRCFLGEIKDF